MTLFIFAVIFTIGTSAICSLLEAMILSTSTAEIESLKKTAPVKGQLLEKFKIEIEATSSAILTLNTIANTLGSILVGALAQQLFESFWVGVTSALMTLGILTFAEIIPKNVGVYYCSQLQPILVYPILVIRWVMWPFSKTAELMVKTLMPTRTDDNLEETQEEEIKLLAEKSANDGSLTLEEKNMIHNTLSLDNLKVSLIMTPRTVVTAFANDQLINDICQEYTNIPFARIPVYQDNIDNIIGIVRRRDILSAKANGQGDQAIHQWVEQSIPFIPETASASDALKTFLKKQQQLAVIVDEFGSTTGVLSMEDVIEHILGQEIYEKDDIAVDMRALARKRARDNKSQNQEKKSPTANKK